MTDTTTEFGSALVESLEEAVAWKRGEIGLETVDIDPMPVDRIRAIRRKVAKSAGDFQRRFGIPRPRSTTGSKGDGRPARRHGFS